MRIAKSLLAALAAPLITGPALAATDLPSGESGITATAYEPIPAGATFRLETEDSSELTYQLQEQLRRELQRLGYGLGDDSPLILTIGTVPPAESADTDPPLKIAGGSSGARLRFFLFGTNSSGLLQDSPESAPGDYRITMSVHDRRTGGFLWRGLATVCRCG